ncbi:MAG: tRNA dihydrouridine synthase DusB [Pseudomonadota bacterium]
MTNATEDRYGALPRVGPHTLTSRVLQSPMAGITDAPFRKLARRFGAALAASEMTTADTRLWQTAKSRHRLDIDSDASPRVVQIAGSEPAQLAIAARAVVDRGADIVDINMGCPAKKVCKKLAGSALLQDEPLVGRILDAVVAAVEVPVTLKTRIGWDLEHRNIARVAVMAENAGIQALAVHGRSRACKYGGQAQFEDIAAVCDALSIPVFANGDIDSAARAEAVMSATGAAGVMVGRATQGQPWLLESMVARLAGGAPVAPLPIEKSHAIVRDHLDDLHAFYGERKGVLMARKHLNWYCRTFGITDQTRRELLRLHEQDAQREMAFRLFNGADGKDSLAA